MAEKYVEVHHLTTGYDPGTPILEDVSFDIGSGEFICVLGPSGCGKSTLLTTLSGLKAPQSGRVLVDGEDIYGRQAALPRLGYVFQDHRLLPWRTVSQNISLALDSAGVAADAHEDIIRTYLDALQIGSFYDAWPLNLSGGQRQRASIARAMAIDPDYLLMDEPFSTLDELTARELRDELLRIWESTGKTIVFVTHSVHEAMFLADRIFVLSTHPGRLYRTIDVNVPRVRSHEDVDLAKLEASVIEDLLVEWGRKDAPAAARGTT